MKQVFIYIVGMAFAMACSDNSNESSELFSIEKSRFIEMDDLKKLGFQRVYGVDVLMMEKTLGDTTITMTYEDDGSSLYSKSWAIKPGIPSIDRNWVEKFVEDQSLNLITQICLNENSDSHFVLKDQSNRMIIGRIIKDPDEIMELYYYYPFSD